MNQDSDTPPASVQRSDSGEGSMSGSSFDDDFVDVGNMETSNDAYCVVSNQSGSRVAVGHSDGFKLFEVKKVVLRNNNKNNNNNSSSSPSAAASSSSPSVYPPYQLVELTRFEGFTGSSARAVNSSASVFIKGKGIGQIALLHDTMYVGAVGAGPNPAASPSTVLLFSRSSLETVIEYSAPVTKLMISRDMVFTLTADQFFTIRTFKGVNLMRVNTHTLNTPADQPLAIDSYRNFIAFPDSKLGSFSVANFADPKNIRIICQNRAAHHHTLTSLALGQATVATTATTTSTPSLTAAAGDKKSSSNNDTATAAAAGCGGTYDATVCVTCSLHGTLIRVWDVTDDANPFASHHSSISSGGGGGRFAGILLCELRASSVPCHIRHLGLNKRSYLYVLIANELKIFFIGKTEKRKACDVSLQSAADAEHITNKESMLKRLEFISSYFASQWAACSVGLPSGGLFLPPWAPKGSIKCIERLARQTTSSSPQQQAIMSNTVTSAEQQQQHQQSRQQHISTAVGEEEADWAADGAPVSISAFLRGAYATWITPETADAARDVVKHSTTAAIAALSTAFNYASNTNVVRAAISGGDYRTSSSLPPPPSGDPLPTSASPFNNRNNTNNNTAHNVSGDTTPRSSLSPTPRQQHGDGDSSNSAAWKNGIKSLWSYTSAAVGNPLHSTYQTGGAVAFPSIPGVFYDPNLSGKQLDDLVCLWWESEQSIELRRLIEWSQQDVDAYNHYQHHQDEDLRRVYIPKAAIGDDWAKVDGEGGDVVVDDERQSGDRDDEENGEDDHSGEKSSTTRKNASSRPLFPTAEGDVLYDNSRHGPSSIATVKSSAEQTPHLSTSPPAPFAVRPKVAPSDYIWSANSKGELVRVGFLPKGGRLTVHRVVPPRELKDD